MRDFKDDTKLYFEELEDYENRLSEIDDYEEIDEYEDNIEDLELDNPEELLEITEENEDLQSEDNSESNAVSKTFDKEKFAKDKLEEKQRCYELIEDTLNSIVMGDSQKLEDLLRVMAQFETYSLNNCILIANQYPKAKQIRTYSDWKEKGVNVLRGSKGIKILAPKTQYYNGEQKTFINVKNVYDENQTDKEKMSLKPKINDDSIYQGLTKTTDVRVVTVESEDIGYRAIDQDFKTVYIKSDQPSHLLNITTLNAILEAITLENSIETENNTRLISNYDNFINECINFIFANRYYKNSTFTEFFIVKVNYEKLDLSVDILKEALKKIRYTTKNIFQAIYNEDKRSKKRITSDRQI